MSAGQVTIYVATDSPTDHITILEAYGGVLYNTSIIHDDVLSLASLVNQQIEVTMDQIRSMYLVWFSALEYILFKIFDTVIVIKRFTLYTPLNRGRGPPQKPMIAD